jgi:predicted Fe-Mo cluster-binding NifX family protein
MKLLITIREDMVAARFDMTTEILIAEADNGHLATEPKIILLPRSSAEDLCGMIVKEDVALVICNGIEESHYQYLLWKKIAVIDTIVGPYEAALALALENRLKPGTILAGAQGD